MPSCILLVPFVDGYARFPGVDGNIDGDVCSGLPPRAGDPQLIPVWLRTDQATIDILKARPECMYLVGFDAERNFVGDTTLTATSRVTILNKLKALGYTGELLGLLQAALQASQKASQVAIAVLLKAFFMSAFEIGYRTLSDGSGINL